MFSKLLKVEGVLWRQEDLTKFNLKISFVKIYIKRK